MLGHERISRRDRRIGQCEYRERFRLMFSSRRVSIVVLGCALWLSACTGGKSGSDGASSDSGKEPRSGATSGTGKSLNLLIWARVLAPNTLADFEKRTGIKIHVSYAVTQEDLETRILAGDSGFDLVSPGADYFQRQIKAGGYVPLDKSKLRNLRNMDPQLMERVSVQDPDNAHGIIYFWGTNGIGYNEKMIKEIMPDAPLDSWRLIFDPAIASTIAKCGIGVTDSPNDLMRAVLPYLGRDPNSQKAEDLAAADDTLTKIRPYIRNINTSNYVEALANGDLCVALGYSGGVLQARDRAREANTGIEIKYVIPKEGSIVWLNMLAIPRHAPNLDSAYAFLDYIMTPQVIADVSNFTHYANANVTALPLLLPVVRDDPAIYPPLELRQRLSIVLPDTPEQLRAISRMWQKFKTGN
jgi:putrescine transport system substrate-binding protein